MWEDDDDDDDADKDCVLLNKGTSISEAKDGDDDDDDDDECEDEITIASFSRTNRGYKWDKEPAAASAISSRNKLSALGSIVPGPAEL